MNKSNMEINKSTWYFYNVISFLYIGDDFISYSYAFHFEVLYRYTIKMKRCMCEIYSTIVIKKVSF